VADLPAVFEEVLEEGLGALEVYVDASARRRLGVYAERLLAWNRKVNLTAITSVEQVAEWHVVDSLALLRTLGEARTLLDIGSGPGVPGVVLAIARARLEVVCCESNRKKVAFVKAIAAELGVSVRAVAVRAEGMPEEEGLARCEAVVSRALAEPSQWMALGARYLVPGGRLFVMLGRGEVGLEELGRANGLELEVVDRFVLPRSRARRANARLRGPIVPRGTIGLR